MVLSMLLGGLNSLIASLGNCGPAPAAPNCSLLSSLLAMLQGHRAAAAGPAAGCFGGLRVCAAAGAQQQAGGGGPGGLCGRAAGARGPAAA